LRLSSSRRTEEDHFPWTSASPSKPDIAIDRILNLTRQAEISGFSFGWIFDSHVIWKEPFPLLTLMAATPKKCAWVPASQILRCATSPFQPACFATSIWPRRGAWNWASGAATAPPSAGEKTTTLENLEEFVRIFRNLNAGKTVDLDGVPTKFPWTNGEFPVWVAATAPRPCAPRDASATA